MFLINHQQNVNAIKKCQIKTPNIEIAIKHQEPSASNIDLGDTDKFLYGTTLLWYDQKHTVVPLTITQYTRSFNQLNALTVQWGNNTYHRKYLTSAASITAHGFPGFNVCCNFQVNHILSDRKHTHMLGLCFVLTWCIVKLPIPFMTTSGHFKKSRRNKQIIYHINLVLNK